MTANNMEQGKGTEDQEKQLRQQWLALKTQEIIRRYGSQLIAGAEIANLARGSALGNWKKGLTDPMDQALRVIFGLAKECGFSLDELYADMQNFVDRGMGRPPSKPQPLTEIRWLQLRAQFNPVTGALTLQDAGVSIDEPVQLDFDVSLTVKAEKSDRILAFGRILDRSIVQWCRLHQVDYTNNGAVSKAIAKIVAIDPDRLALLRAGLVEPDLYLELSKLVSIGLYRVDGTKLTESDARRILGVENGKKSNANMGK